MLWSRDRSDHSKIEPGNGMPRYRIVTVIYLTCLISSSILPDMEIVRVRRVMIMSGKRRPSGIGDPTEVEGDREPRLGGVAAIVAQVEFKKLDL